MIQLTKQEIEKELGLSNPEDIGFGDDVVLQYIHRTTYFLWVTVKSGHVVAISGIRHNTTNKNLNIDFKDPSASNEQVIERLKAFLNIK